MSVAIEPTVEADFTFAQDAPFRLAGGDSLQSVTLRYAIYGELNEARDNALVGTRRPRAVTRQIEPVWRIAHA